MQSYELVIVLIPRLSPDDRTKTIGSVEKMLGSGLVEKDDIGLVPFVSVIDTYDQGYFCSYHIHADSALLDQLDETLSLDKNLIRHKVFRMKEGQSFLKFSDMSAKFAPPQSTDDEEVAEDSESESSDSEEVIVEKAAVEADL